MLALAAARLRDRLEAPCPGRGAPVPGAAGLEEPARGGTGRRVARRSIRSSSAAVRGPHRSDRLLRPAPRDEADGRRHLLREGHNGRSAIIVGRFRAPSSRTGAAAAQDGDPAGQVQGLPRLGHQVDARAPAGRGDAGADDGFGQADFACFLYPDGKSLQEAQQLLVDVASFLRRKASVLGGRARWAMQKLLLTLLRRGEIGDVELLGFDVVGRRRAENPRSKFDAPDLRLCMKLRQVVMDCLSEVVSRILRSRVMEKDESDFASGILALCAVRYSRIRRALFQAVISRAQEVEEIPQWRAVNFSLDERLYMTEEGGTGKETRGAGRISNFASPAAGAPGGSNPLEEEGGKEDGAAEVGRGGRGRGGKATRWEG